MKHELLDKKFGEALQSFKEEMKSSIEMIGLRQKQAVTKDDLENLSRQVFYCLDDFRKVIVTEIKAQEDNIQ